MAMRDMLYEGKSKIVYATDDPAKVIQYFTDDATAFNAAKRGTIVGKGVINNKMSAALFQRLAKAGIPTHYLETLSDRAPEDLRGPVKTGLDFARRKPLLTTGIIAGIAFLMAGSGRRRY